MKKVCALILTVLLLILAAVGCSSNEPLEEARVLKANGYQTSYHQYMWSRLNTNETESITETTFSHTESDAFFAIVRISTETAKAQGLTSAENLETLLKTYVTNYAGTDEKITSADNETQYIRTLTFQYHDAEVDEDFTYLAKLVMDKNSGELMIILAAHPKKSDNLLKNEISLIMDNAVMTEMVAV